SYNLILISETWLCTEDSDAYLLGSNDDYVSFRKDRPTNAEITRGGGLAILCSPLLNPFLVSSFATAGIESIIIDIHFPHSISSLSSRSIRICLIYRAPSCPSSSLESFLSFINPFVSTSPFIICGDLNFPSIDWSNFTSPTQNDFLSFVSDNHFTQFVDFKTRGDNILDLILCNSNIVNDVKPSIPFADHTSISFSLSAPSPPSRKFIPSRLYNLADWNAINFHLFSHDWTFALSPLDIDNSLNYFSNFANSLLDTFVPKSSPSPFSRYPRHLRILYGKSKRATSIARNSALAITLSKRFERALREHHVRVESRIVDSKSPRAFYSLCNTRLKACKSAPPAQILVAILSLAPKCNFSPDGIPNIFYSKCKFSIVSPLLIIFNKSLLTNTIPSIWKQAIVKPIPKTASNSINNFRPISLTCSVTKIFEKILIYEINEYMNGNNLLDSHQSGFRRNLSLNETKCTVVHYGSFSPRTHYTINNIPLSASPFMKDLGIIMSPSIKFTDHVSKMISKARAKINIMFKCFFSLDPYLYCRAFTTFIRPILEYGSVVWSPHTIILANQIEVVQRNFTRRLFARCQIPYSLYPDRLSHLSLQTLEHRRMISDLLFIHKSIAGFYSYDHSKIYRLAPLSRNLRRSHNLRISLPFVPPKSHSNFATRIIERWNALSAEIVTSSPHFFRSHLLSTPSISFSPESLLRL
ncbi:hypothetical protein PENTCL1PPCAC_12389, partial [Pristionchus entomophagus]